MKQEIQNLQRSLYELECKMKGLTFSDKQAYAVFDSIEDFLYKAANNVNITSKYEVLKAQSGIDYVKAKCNKQLPKSDYDYAIEILK